MKNQENKKGKTKMTEQNISSFKHYTAKEGWKLVKDVTRVVKSITDLDVVSCLRYGKRSIGGGTLQQYAREIRGNFGQRQAKYLLEHQDGIPEAWRKYYLIFPGTVRRGPVGGLHVPCLQWDGRRWYPIFHWLGLNWDSRGRLVHLRK